MHRHDIEQVESWLLFPDSILLVALLQYIPEGKEKLSPRGVFAPRFSSSRDSLLAYCRKEYFKFLFRARNVAPSLRKPNHPLVRQLPFVAYTSEFSRFSDQSKEWACRLMIQILDDYSLSIANSDSLESRLNPL